MAVQQDAKLRSRDVERTESNWQSPGGSHGPVRGEGKMEKQEKEKHEQLSPG